MKRKMIKLSFVVSLCTMLFSMTVLAEEKTMPDGMVFDAEYYAQNNPDVTGALGTDVNVLYEHYKNFGKAEGRKPHAEVSINNTSSKLSVPTNFSTIYINQKDGFEGQFFTHLDRTKFPGIDNIEYIKGLDICSQIERIRDEETRTFALVGLEPGMTTEELMSYAIGGSGILESYVKNSPTEYSFYILNNGLRYRIDLHYNENLRIQSFDYGVIGTVTEQEIEAAEMNLPNFEHEVQYVTMTWTEEELASFR